MMERTAWRSPNGLTNEQAMGLMAQGINPQDVLVVQPNDWQRIQNTYNKRNAEKEQCEAQKRERSALHEKSKQLVKNWENTIEGQRLKKLQARNIREEHEEEERKKIDIEEAKLQAEKRKIAIEKAKQVCLDVLSLPFMIGSHTCRTEPFSQGIHFTTAPNAAPSWIG